MPCLILLPMLKWLLVGIDYDDDDIRYYFFLYSVYRS